VSKLTRLLLARAQPKRIGFVPVSGVMLAGLAEAYAAAINEGAVPTIATAWQVCWVQLLRSTAMPLLFEQHVTVGWLNALVAVPQDAILLQASGRGSCNGVHVDAA
jgi:hypothetical protein